MSAPRFLADECFRWPIVTSLRQREPTIDILCIGEAGAPPKSTLDPQVLLAAEAMQRVLLSFDRQTMSGHLQNHFQAGHHTWGLVQCLAAYPYKRYTEDILLIWSATKSDDWYDRIDIIPY